MQNKNIQKTKVVIVGGGYAGLKTLHHLAKNIRFEIILLDKNPYHFMQTDVYDLIANEVDFAGVSVDLFTYCSGYENAVFLKEEVLHVDFAHKKVVSDKQRHGYDYLVIGVGARTRFLDSIEGLREHAHGIKALHRALYFKQKFEMSLFKKVDEEGVSCTPLSIVVAGAGLSGVEIAAQMASFAKEFYEKNHFICRKLNIVLVNGAEQILKGLDAHMVQVSQKRLVDLGVTIKHKTKVTGLSATEVFLSTGEKIATDFMIYAGGIEPNALVFNLDLPKDERGFISTEPTLHVKGFEDVFAVGDCTTLKDKQGRVLAPTADIAEQMGVLCAKNIIASVQKRKLQEHNITSRGILVALGKGYASAKVFGLHVDGYVAYVMKKAIEYFYAKSLDKRSKKGCIKIFSR